MKRSAGEGDFFIYTILPLGPPPLGKEGEAGKGKSQPTLANVFACCEAVITGPVADNMMGMKSRGEEVINYTSIYPL